MNTVDAHRTNAILLHVIQNPWRRRRSNGIFRWVSSSNQRTQGIIFCGKMFLNVSSYRWPEMVLWDGPEWHERALFVPGCLLTRTADHVRVRIYTVARVYT